MQKFCLKQSRGSEKERQPLQGQQRFWSKLQRGEPANKDADIYDSGKDISDRTNHTVLAERRQSEL